MKRGHGSRVMILRVNWDTLRAWLRLPANARIVGAAGRDYNSYLGVLVESPDLPRVPEGETTPFGEVVVAPGAAYGTLVPAAREEAHT